MIQSRGISADDLEENTLEIMRMCGGICSLLMQHLLSHPNTFNQRQLQRLHQILDTPRSVEERQREENVSIKDGRDLQYTFDPTNHYLHEELVQYLYSKMIIVLMVILGLVGFALVHFFPQTLVMYCYWIPLHGFYIIWFTLLLLSLNKKCMLKLAATFDFWIKSGYGVMFRIAFFVRVVTGRDVFENVLVQRAENILNVISVVLLILLIASLDAMPRLSREWKTGISVVCALDKRRLGVILTCN